MRISLLLSLFLAVLILNLCVDDLKLVRYDQLALGHENHETRGIVDGIPVHCQDMLDHASCFDPYKPFRLTHKLVLWLGNSQLHAINQFKTGQQPSSVHLHKELRDSHHYALTLSQPNANLQEHYLLFAYSLTRFSVDTLILPVVFDDMRETGIRPSLVDALQNQHTKYILGQSSVGKGIIASYSYHDSSGNDMPALNNTFQENSERFLNNSLADFWPVWANREQLRSEFTLSLYLLRNWIFGITPSTTRKMIAGRYATNMDAFKETLLLASSKKIKVLVYIVPLRNDIAVPYDPKEYLKFKQQILSLASEFGAGFSNLEDIVPPQFWGTKNATSIGGGQENDFMHFQEPGHILMTHRLKKDLAKIWNSGPRL